MELVTEIWHGVRNKPARAILSCIGIMWGIFVVVVLVGLGSCLERGVLKLFDGYSKGATYIIAAQTTKSYRGVPEGKTILFSYDDINMLVSGVPEISSISPEVTRRELVSTDKTIGNFELRGVHPDYFEVKILKVSKGRLLNLFDVKDKRRKVVIGQNLADFFYKNSNPIGKMMKIKGIMYEVVGVIERNMMSMAEDQIIYIPYSTLLSVDRNVRCFSTILYATKDALISKKVDAKVRNKLSRMKGTAPDDNNVFFFSSREEQVDAFGAFFNGLRHFLWFIGMTTLLSGVIGVSNIMYISTKERIREIGIRKAFGTKDSYIKKMFIMESVILTLIAGGLGVVLGWIFLKLIGLAIDNVTIFQKPDIDIKTTFIALLILFMSGMLAGLKPAIDASKLNPVDALKKDN